MITLSQYVGIHKDSPDWTVGRQINAQKLLAACLLLENDAIADEVEFPINPKTKTQVSGETFGGFRPQDCPVGASNSSHKEGLGVDLYDPDNKIDAWCMAHQTILKKYGVFMEHPSATPGWAHWSTRVPDSGHTVFYP